MNQQHLVLLQRQGFNKYMTESLDSQAGKENYTVHKKKGKIQYLCFSEPPTFATASLHSAAAFLAFTGFSVFLSKARTPNS